MVLIKMLIESQLNKEIHFELQDILWDEKMKNFQSFKIIKFIQASDIIDINQLEREYERTTIGN